MIDSRADTLGDARLLAHLSADEPPKNAHVVCALYLADQRRLRCRALTRGDLHGPPEGQPSAPTNLEHTAKQFADDNGVSYVLAATANGQQPVQLRWHRCVPHYSAKPLTLRQVIGALQSYEPARSLSEGAIRARSDRSEVSLAQLRAELDRLQGSHIVLNRGLREAVLDAVKHNDVTLSEIAIRCGRIKREEHGKESGETSWLARRIGLLSEGGHEAPTPWVSSDVLALIARQGLGVAPREVELA
ncbi:MAG TPA: hypothetical protein VGX51_05205 [Solirubrobacteraceae bacterium]|nr:hypothetical protein [Solirubrobacteraceae bacterium]